ncbi:aquaporin-10 [Tetranychus urticae]|uniref:Aquaporin n=1 Tax=Tetranychus urticae TaxID=32264 RepID=T1JTQ8_TETUR|nr:aquaporin-10 [Tetranychus urticae]XP_015785942.1 aquaporin-10 [Tetranychus urticae]
MAQIAYQFLSKFKTKNLLYQQFIIELVGTFILIVLIDNAVATYTFGHPSDHFAIATTAGVGLYIAVVFGATVSAGHVNPVVTFALATLRKCPWKSVPVYFAGQFIGGFAATVVSFANQRLAIVARSGLNGTFPSKTASLFMSNPGIRPVDHETVILDQVLCVGILMFAIMVLIDGSNNHNSKSATPFGLLFVLIAVILAFGSNAGAAINPARDLPARLFGFMIGLGDMWSDMFWLTASTIGTFLGAVVGAWTYYLTVEIHRINDNADLRNGSANDLNLTELRTTLDKLEALVDAEKGLKSHTKLLD